MHGVRPAAAADCLHERVPLRRCFLRGAYALARLQPRLPRDSAAATPRGQPEAGELHARPHVSGRTPSPLKGSSPRGEEGSSSGPAQRLDAPVVGVSGWAVCGGWGGRASDAAAAWSESCRAMMISMMGHTQGGAPEVHPRLRPCDPCDSRAKPTHQVPRADQHGKPSTDGGASVG